MPITTPNSRDAIRVGIVMAALWLYILSFSVIPFHVRGMPSEQWQVLVVALCGAIVCFILGVVNHKRTGRIPKQIVPRRLWLTCFLTNMVVTCALLVPAAHTQPLLKASLLAWWLIASAWLFLFVLRQPAEASKS
jgi:hypothetical protein